MRLGVEDEAGSSSHAAVSHGQLCYGCSDWLSLLYRTNENLCINSRTSEREGSSSQELGQLRKRLCCELITIFTVGLPLG